MFAEMNRYFTVGQMKGDAAGGTADSQVSKGKFCNHGILWLSAAFLLLHFFWAASVFGGKLSHSEERELYRQGTEYFHQAVETEKTDPDAARDLFEKAAFRFERLVAEGGVRNGKLFYNIGNIHFLLGDIGRAILNYRRAGLYIPNDPNLEYAPG